MTKFLIKTFSQVSKLGAMIALVATNLSAEEISSEAKHWNKVDQLIVDCETAQSFSKDDQVRNAASELWQLTDIPFGLRTSAESCVSEYLDRDAIFTWDSGWEFLLSGDDIRVLPASVLDIIEEHKDHCNMSEDGELQVPVTAIERIDLTGNAEPDTVFHSDKLRCGASGSYFSGSGGSHLYLIVKDKVTRFVARSFAVSYALGEGFPIIILAVHGSACDGYGATNCVLATVWGDDKFEVVRTKRE
jgi:hypothetical protein